MLIHDKKLVLIADQPIGIKDLPQDIVSGLCLFRQYLFLKQFHLKRLFCDTSVILGIWICRQIFILVRFLLFPLSYDTAPNRILHEVLHFLFFCTVFHAFRYFALPQSFFFKRFGDVFFYRFYILWFRSQYHFRNHFFLGKSPGYGLGGKIKKGGSVCKADIHFCGVDVYVYRLRIQIKMQYRKRIFMLHQIPFVSFFDGLGNQPAFDETSVDKIVFVIAVCPVYRRFSKKSHDFHTRSFAGKREYFPRNVPSVDPVNDLL